ALQSQSSTRRPQRVVGLVTAVVERGHHAVADELFHLPTEPTRDQRRRNAPVRVEHRGSSGRRGAFRETGEPDEIGKEDTHVLVALPSGRQVEPTKAFLTP